MGTDEVTRLLQLALPRPSLVKQDPTGAAVVSLALHCLMVRAGFTVDTEGRGAVHSSYTPPPQWHGKFKDEWVFQYVRDNCENNFILHCSLQSASGRLFVHASETNNTPNTRVLGLQVPNYVPDRAGRQSDDWEGVVKNGDKLIAMFTEHITQPLIQGAVEAHYEYVGSNTDLLLSARSYAGYYFLAVCVVGVAVGGAYIYSRSRSKGK